MNRRIRIAQACIAGLALGSLLAGSRPSRSYTKDLQVEYLSAWALRDGLDPFTPTTELSARYFPSPTSNFAHPNPHPPVLALLGLPLTVLPFPAAVALWLIINIALLILVGHWLGLSVPATLPLAAWPPLWCMLYIGQFELLILVLAMLGWRAARAQRDWQAGFWLGVAASIKLYPVFLLVPYLVRRRGRLLLAAGLVLAATQLGNLLVVGPSGYVRYYGEILPAVSGLYTRYGLNSAPYGALLRLFGGATDVAAVIPAPGVVAPLTIACSLFALLALVTLEPESAPVALLVGLPSVWYYYAVLAVPQIAALLRCRRWRSTTLLICAALSVVLPLVNLLVRWIGDAAPPMAILLAIQSAGFIGLLILTMLTSADRRVAIERG